MSPLENHLHRNIANAQQMSNIATKSTVSILLLFRGLEWKRVIVEKGYFTSTHTITLM